MNRIMVAAWFGVSLVAGVSWAEVREVPLDEGIKVLGGNDFYVVGLCKPLFTALNPNAIPTSTTACGGCGGTIITLKGRTRVSKRKPCVDPEFIIRDSCACKKPFDKPPAALECIGDTTFGKLKRVFNCEPGGERCTLPAGALGGTFSKCLYVNDFEDGIARKCKKQDGTLFCPPPPPPPPPPPQP